MSYNNFFEIDPRNLKQDDDCWFMFTENLLQLHHEKASITLDLGWNPDISSDGQFLVLIIKDMDWENPIQEFMSNDYRKVIEYIEFHLNQITLKGWKY